MRGAKYPKKGETWIVKSYSTYVSVAGIVTRKTIPIPYGSYLLFLEDMKKLPQDTKESPYAMTSHHVTVLWKDQKCSIVYGYVINHMERLK